MKKILKYLILLLLIYSCDREVVPPMRIDFKESNEVLHSEGNATLIIQGGRVGERWIAEVIEGGEWCKLAESQLIQEGEINENINILYLYYSENVDMVDRTATLIFQIEGEDEIRLELIQKAFDPEEVGFGPWAESPKMEYDPDYEFVAHYAELGGKKVRNFSLCFDKTKSTALWVAYPLHYSYLGSQQRTNVFLFDPEVSNVFQANCTEYSYAGNWDRGHQLPSADRTANYELNMQTFYMSNMTPQWDRLNQDMWARLEGVVRNQICSDTLYVVTGAHFEDTEEFTYDGAGKKVPLPTHYYKVILRSKLGNTGKSISQLNADEIISIGFWVEHRSYGDIFPPKSICVSVADIEDKTGFDFFSLLSEDVEEEVKTQNNPSMWGIN